MRIWVISAMIFTIQPQKVAKINKAVMSKIGLDLAEMATLVMNQIQRLGGCMADSKRIYYKEDSTSLPVSHHLSSCYYDIQVLMFSFILWRGESNEMKLWV